MGFIDNLKNRKETDWIKKPIGGINLTYVCFGFEVNQLFRITRKFLREPFLKPDGAYPFAGEHMSTITRRVQGD